MWAVDDGDQLEIRGVVVEADRRGGWAFARWFLALPKDRKVVATRVTDERLAQVFVRGGFRRVSRYDAALDEWEWVYVRKPPVAPCQRSSAGRQVSGPTRPTSANRSRS